MSKIEEITLEEVSLDIDGEELVRHLVARDDSGNTLYESESVKVVTADGHTFHTDKIDFKEVSIDE